LTGTFFCAFPLPASEEHADEKKAMNTRRKIAPILIPVIL